MSNATIGSFTTGEWNAIKSDDRTYNALIKKYGSLKEAQRNGVNTKSTRSGLSLSNAHNTVKVMSGQRQYKTNLSKRTGYHLEGKKTQYNQSSTLSVKMGRGNRVKNTRAAGGATPMKQSIQTTWQRHQQNAAAYATKNITRGTKSGTTSNRGSSSSGSKSGTRSGTGSGRSTRGTTTRQKIKQTGRGSGGLLRNKKGTTSNKAHTRREKNKKRRR